MVSVIASSVRKGNVLEKDGKLYVVIRAENIHPGKGTPVTHLEMRRISDGVKTQERYKTTETVEKAFIDEDKYNYLYQDGDNYVFMEPNTFEQVSVPKGVIGDGAAYLQENMEVSLSQYNGMSISVELPPRVVLEIVETEPVHACINLNSRRHLPVGPAECSPAINFVERVEYRRQLMLSKNIFATGE